MKSIPLIIVLGFVCSYASAELNLKNYEVCEMTIGLPAAPVDAKPAPKKAANMTDHQKATCKVGDVSFSIVYMAFTIDVDADKFLAGFENGQSPDTKSTLTRKGNNAVVNQVYSFGLYATMFIFIDGPQLWVVTLTGTEADLTEELKGEVLASIKPNIRPKTTPPE